MVRQSRIGSQGLATSLSDIRYYVSRITIKFQVMKNIFFFLLGVLTMWCLEHITWKIIGLSMVIVAIIIVLAWFFDRFTEAVNARNREDMSFVSTQDHKP